MKQKITIAIDGYSSTGKSTIAKELASKLGYVYVDTGAMYRAVTLFAIKNKLIEANVIKKQKLIDCLPDIELSFCFNKEKGYAEMYLNHINVEEKIRTLQVSNWVSKVAEIPQVRKKLVVQQQQFGIEKGVVMDGRDIGTVVFPKAELKLFMTASAKVRAKRRYDEMLSKGEKVTFSEVLKNVKMRDNIDINREDSPLCKAKDAIEIDNSELTKEEQFQKIYALAIQKIEANNSSSIIKTGKF